MAAIGGACSSSSPAALEDAGRFYQEHIELSERLYQRHTLEQVELLLDFIRTGREFNEQHAQRIEDENRARGKAPPRARGSAAAPEA